MSNSQYLRNHIVRLLKSKSSRVSPSTTLLTLYYGDRLRVIEETEEFTKIALEDGKEGWIKGELKLSNQPLLSLAFIDVGQGDACLIETPCQKRIMVDGGENKLASRYLAKRFWHLTKSGETIPFDAFVITHGDADHFAGLSKLVLESANEKREGKQITVSTSRVFHNGLAKRSAKTSSGTRRKEIEMFGETVELENGETLVSELIEDIRSVPENDLNKHFQKWRKALEELEKRQPVQVQRIDSETSNVFHFIEDVSVEVLGPEIVKLADGSIGLPFLLTDNEKALDAGKTINGHSIVLRLTYGNVRILLSGDLNAQTEERLFKKHEQGQINLEAEVFKVPHHGSEDASLEFFRAVKPVVSIISAGDESAAKDYLHPRASILGAIGKAGRGEAPLVFVTDLNAFDRYVGPALLAKKSSGGYIPEKDAKMFYARERSAYGITHVRTDGETLFIARRGASTDKVEVYVYKVLGDGRVKSMKVDKL